jgi:hypothetical protein
LSLSGLLAGLIVVSSAAIPVGAATGSAYTSQVPNRILDTRTTGGTLSGGGSINLTVAGGTTGVPASATGVVLNVTVTDTTAQSFLKVTPAGTSPATVSNLNWVAGETRANLVNVPVGTGGQVTISNGVGSVDVVVDEEGYFGAQVGTIGGYNALAPARLLDTRLTAQTMSTGSSIDLQVTGAGGVPATGVSAVVLNATATNTATQGFFTLFPTGATRPTASNVNWAAGWTLPNRVIVGVGTGVNSGRVTIYNGQGAADAVIDVSGYFTDGTATGALFTPLAPVRILDTRSAGGTIGPNGTLNNFQITGANGVAAGASAVFLNTTVTNTTASSALTVFPGGTRPTASDLNWKAGQTIPNQTLATLNSTGGASFYNFVGSTDLVLDLSGYFGGAPGGTAFFSATASQSSLKVIFTTTMNNGTTGNGAANPANYSVTSPSGAGAQTPTAVSYSTVDNSATLTLATALVPGSTFTVTVPAAHQIDNSGATASVAAGSSISGTVAAAAPAIAFPTAADCLSTHNTGGATPTYKGTYPTNGATINVYVDNTAATGAPTGITTVALGAWSLTQPTALTAAGHTVTATATVGTVTSSATTVSFSSSTATPVSPVITSPANGTTTANTPTISGTGTAGSTVNVVFNGGAAPVTGNNTTGVDVAYDTAASNGTATVAGNGTWSYTPTTALAAGASTAIAYPVLCNFVGTASSSLSFTVAAGPGTAPTITTSSAGSNTASITFTDSSEVAQSVTGYNVYRNNGAASGFATSSKIGSPVTATGAASYTFVDSTAVNGSYYTYFVTAFNSFASESGPSGGVTPASTVAPIVSAVTITPNPVSAGSSAVYSATVAAGATVDPTVMTGGSVLVRVIDHNGSTVSSAAAACSGTCTNGFGTYTLTAAAPVTAGAYTDNTLATDASGNSASSTTAFTVQAAGVPTSVTWSPTSASLVGTAGSNTALFVATVKDQYGATVPSGTIVGFSVKPSNATTGGAVGTVTACATTNGIGQVSVTYTGNTKLAATENDTITATAYTAAACTGTATVLTGTATATVTASPAPAAGIPFITAATVTGAHTIQITYNIPVTTTNALAAAPDFVVGGFGATAISGSGTSVITLTYAATFVTGTSAGNLSYAGTALDHVASAADATKLGFTPQDIYTVSGF